MSSKILLYFVFLIKCIITINAMFIYFGFNKKYHYFWFNRPGSFTFYDFFRLLITSFREYKHVLTSLYFVKLSWRCITVALFSKIKKPVIGLTTNSQEFIKLAEVFMHQSVIFRLYKRFRSSIFYCRIFVEI